MANDNYTVKEHFIPQCYLGQFSPDEKTITGEKNSFDKRHIHQYDVVNQIQSEAPISIKSVCYEKNLYEFKNQDGDFLFRNLIEEMYSKYDGHFASAFRSIRSKARCEANFRLTSFLNNHEKVYLLFFFSTLILRNPEIINAGMETAKALFGEKINNRAARNLTLKMCMPLYEAIKSDEKTILNAIMSWFDNMTFQVGAFQEDLLMTSDRPLIIFGKNDPVKIHKVLCPISPRVVIQMTPNEDTPSKCRNCLRPLSYRDSITINRETALHCNRWIFSKTFLTKKQINWISRERSKG